MLRTLTMTLAMIGFTAFTQAQEGPTADKLVGTWQLTKSSEELPPGAVAKVEFQKDSKMTMTMEVLNKKIVMNGTWKLEGKKLTVNMESEGKKHTESVEVVKLTAMDFHTKDDKGKLDEFKKVVVETKPK